MMILEGLVLGFLSATVTESIGHRFFGHPAPWQLRLYFRFPGLFTPMLRCYYQHLVIHHERTFQTDMLTQFRNPEDQANVDRWITETFPRSFAELIWRERYNLTLVGVEGILPFTLPFLIVPLMVLAFLGPMAFAVCLPVSITPVLISRYIHPFLHAIDDLPHSNRLIRWIAKSSYMRWAFQNHFLHHRHPLTNFNLLPGGDYLVGHYRAPTPEELTECRALWRRFEVLWR